MQIDALKKYFEFHDTDMDETGFVIHTTSGRDLAGPMEWHHTLNCVVITDDLNGDTIIAPEHVVTIRCAS